MTYEIYEDFMEMLEKKLNRIIKKCQKHGNDFVYEKVGETYKKIETVDKETGRTRTDVYKFIIINVEGTAHIADWECIAVMEPYREGNVIRKINTNMEVPDKYYSSEPMCDHCKTKRKRKELYVIHNMQTDEWKQVGGTCLKLYTNGLSLEYVTSYLSGITELEECTRMTIEHGKVYYPVESVLSYAMEIINKTGYFNSNSDCSTKSLVANMLSPWDFDRRLRLCNSDLRNARIDAYFDKNDFYKPETQETVRNVTNYYLGLNGDSEFVKNVQTILKEKYVRPQDIGYLCYLPDGYKKYLEMERAKAERIQTADNYFGEIGREYKNVEIYSIKLLSSGLCEWGKSYFYGITIRHTDGKLYNLTWSTSKYIYSDEYTDLEFDKISFRVKEYREYKGRRITRVHYCKLSYKKAEAA